MLWIISAGIWILRMGVMAACDPVLVDAYVCQMMHYEVAEVPYVKLAGELGVGCSDISKADVRFLEDGADQRMPISRKVVELADAVEEVESCSACYGYLIPALEMLKEEGLFEKLDEKICIGQGYRGKKGVLGVGHCTCKFQNYVEGCPPLEGDIYEFLKGYIGERAGLRRGMLLRFREPAKTIAEGPRTCLRLKQLGPSAITPSPAT